MTMKTSFWLYSAAFGALILILRSSKPRGLRNNNAGNIRAVDGVLWQGQIGIDDAGFVIFDTALNGLRALARVLKTYRQKYGLISISGIISRWAPSNENDTTSYIKSVEMRVGLGANTPLSLEHYPALVKAIIHHENGKQPYSDDEINQGVTLGFV